MQLTCTTLMHINHVCKFNGHINADFGVIFYIMIFSAELDMIYENGA